MKRVLGRLLSMIPVLLGVMLLIFIMLRVVPGDPVSILLGEHYSQETVERLTRAMNLDKPLFEQFVSYVAGALRGDLGVSYAMKRPVTELILRAFPYTLKLTVLALVFAWGIGLTTGIIAAITKNKAPDRIFMAFSLAGVSMPIFMAALILQYFLAYKLKLVPVTSNGSMVSMILPAIALGWNSAGSVARMTRSSLIDVMMSDYIDTARAKGLTRSAVIFRHALKNSMLPVITMMTLQLSSMLSGAVVTESVFAIPGIPEPGHASASGNYTVYDDTRHAWKSACGFTVHRAGSAYTQSVRGELPGHTDHPCCLQMCNDPAPMKLKRRLAHNGRTASAHAHTSREQSRFLNRLRGGTRRRGQRRTRSVMSVRDVLNSYGDVKKNKDEHT